MTIEDVGKFLESTFCRDAIHEISIQANQNCTVVPVNLKEQDAFHLTIEEYLLALIAMVEELVRVPVLYLTFISTNLCSLVWLLTLSLWVTTPVPCKLAILSRSCSLDSSF
jgi:hypothetical protein